MIDKYHYIETLFYLAARKPKITCYEENSSTLTACCGVIG